MQSILTDFTDIKDDEYLFILPIERLTIQQKSEVGKLAIYPKGTINIDELLGNHAFLEDNSNEINKLKEHTLVVFKSKSPVNFSAQVTNNNKLLDFAIDYATPVLDWIIFKYCNISNRKTLPGRIGQINSGESILLMFNGIGSPFTRIISEKIYTNTITYGNGLNINESGLLNNYHLSNNDLNEIGNIAKHALRMYTQTLEASTNTEKFIQIIRLFEFIATPDKYEKFQNVKAKITSHIAKNIHQRHEISEEFKYYSSGENGNGLRTQIFHNGKRIEELLNVSELNELFIKLHKYLFICISDLLSTYNKKWEVIEQLRTTKRDEAERNKIKTEVDNYSSTIVLIDGNFLSASIKRFQKMYVGVYPNKKLDKISLVNLCYEILLNTRQWKEGSIYSFLVFYSGISKFPFVEESFEEMNGKEIKVEDTNFEFHTFQVETEEQILLGVNKLLNDFSHNRKMIDDMNSLFENIVFCGDNKKYESSLNELDKKGSKEIIIIRNTHDSEMNLPIKSFDIGHLVGKLLRLKSNEL